jgi:inner membrane protein involved in colicin E2 resistance
MKASRLAAVLLIYLGVSAAWAILGTSVFVRTQDSLTRLRSQVTGLWGTPLEQRAPRLLIQETVHAKDKKGKVEVKEITHQVIPDSSDIKVKLHSDARRKGLLWYRTYAVEFDGTYTVKHDFTQQPVLVTYFFFPSEDAIYDDFRFSINGQEVVPAGGLSGGLTESVPLPAGETATIKVHYKSRGLDQWTYAFEQGVSQVKNFAMVVDTDFRRINFPAKSLSPTKKEELSGGWRLTWKFASLISGFTAGVEMPEEINPGPIISRITYFAPVGLVFFLAIVVIIGMMRRKNLHPMHYFFVGGGFFAFHLLMAYLADHLDLRLTFLISAIVSVLLVASYLIRVIGANFTIKVVAPAQIVYLILFSYAFFFQGYTGLTITIASILTLAILMHITAKVDWESRCAAPPGS